MSFINKLDETHKVFNKLNDLILGKSNKHDLKQHLLSISRDLAKYKEIDEKKIGLVMIKLNLKSLMF